MIDMNKKYKTGDGLSVRILCVDAAMKDYCVITLVSRSTENGGKEEILKRFTKEGKSYVNGPDSIGDLVEVSPYEDFKTDDLCVVWDRGNGVRFRYFSHVDKHSGEALFFAEGKTSFTHDSHTTWPNCRKATPLEIATKIVV
jgi:hypothetical protein